MGDLGEEHLARMTTARTRELGHELHLARKRANLKATAVAEELGWSPGKLSKLERGWRQTSDWDYGVLLGKLGADQATRARIQQITAESDIGHFIRTFDGGLPDSLLCLSIHERSALTMCTYEPIVIHGLLQTEAYARTVINPEGIYPTDRHDQLVAARMQRQEMLGGPHSPEAVFYIHEAALGNKIGSDRIMHDQMMRLAFMCEWARLSPRVIPRKGRGSGYLAVGFSLMTFTKPIKPVAHSDTDVASVFTEDDKSIELYRRKQKALAELALDAEQSRLMFAQWADVYDRREDCDAQGSDLAQEQLQQPRGDQLR
ncbi:helix-turn-helix transcriptional regulator [Umezawaea sp. Da 62-37]|uniref:helix-turn-helix domain-containing protein n=1 Tax=Umezawaea sp. Da 62-37 TaxID=3075927 RepID=UPI0028F73569|nr:helix-turn-helix transcriptional regulator [Umezawaea sp. Da 62-37]WNV82293.1 helix-turn-helix transcriptional regulator [Umezawaea sp. Da 62-37]